MKKTKKNTQNNSPIKRRLNQQLKCCCFWRSKSRSNFKTISITKKQRDRSKSKSKTKTKQKCKKQLNLPSKISYKNLSLSRSPSSQQPIKIKQKVNINKSLSICQCMHQQSNCYSKKSPRSEFKRSQKNTSHKKLKSNIQQPSQLNFFLDNYQNILNQRIEVLKKKWNQLKILQKLLSQNKQQKNMNRQPNQHVLSVQNQFYVAKITQLQNQLKIKDQQIRNMNISIRNTTSHISPELQKQNKRLKQQNQLLERQNRVLKNKLKQAGFL